MKDLDPRPSQCTLRSVLVSQSLSSLSQCLLTSPVELSALLDRSYSLDGGLGSTPLAVYSALGSRVAVPLMSPCDITGPVELRLVSQLSTLLDRSYSLYGGLGYTPLAVYFSFDSRVAVSLISLSMPCDSLDGGLNSTPLAVYSALGPRVAAVCYLSLNIF